MAVGESSLGSGIGPSVVGVIEEWDGSTWSMAPNPQSSGVNVWFSSVSCPSASRCFAVGQDNTDGGFIDTWDGASWTMSFNQQVVSLSAVSCSDPDEPASQWEAGLRIRSIPWCWPAGPGRPNLCPTQVTMASFTTYLAVRRRSVWRSARYKLVASGGRPVLRRTGTANRGSSFQVRITPKMTSVRAS